eukprot:754200-Hanusia_phi.AAC.5
MHHASSSESFGAMLGAAPALPRNVSNESLGGMMPRTYSSSSLDAVLESNEGWPGEEEGAQESAANGSLGVDFDFLNRSSNAPPTPHNWAATPRAHAVEGNGDLAFLSRGLPESMGHPGQPALEQGVTGKRMQRTHSHNNLVREAAVRPVLNAPPSGLTSRSAWESRDAATSELREAEQSLPVRVPSAGREPASGKSWRDVPSPLTRLAASEVLREERRWSGVYRARERRVHSNT